MSTHLPDRADSSTDDRIIAAALGLIAEHGLGSVTMRRIAETAGVARQTLYNHYPDVDAIVTAATSRHNQESIEMLDTALRVVDEPLGKLEQLVRHVVAVAIHANHAPGIEGGLSAAARAALREYSDTLDQRIRGIIEQGQRSGTFRGDLSADIDAALIRHMLNGLGERSANDPTNAPDIAETGIRTISAAVIRR